MSSDEDTSLGKSGSSRRCKICDVHFTSIHDRVQHYTSLFHKFMKRKKQKQLSFIKKFRRFDRLVKAVEKEEPLLGLEYIYQYIPNNSNDVPYECRLCKTDHWNLNIFLHIVGIKHRTLYLDKHHPMMGIRSDFKAESPRDYTKLLEVAQAVEQSHGRKQINVVNTFLSRREDRIAKGNSEPDASSEDERGNPESTFSNPDNTLDREGSPEMRHGGINADNCGRNGSSDSRFQLELPKDQPMNNQYGDYNEHGDPFMKGSNAQKDDDNALPRMSQRSSPDKPSEHNLQPPLHRKASQYSGAEGSIAQPGCSNVESQLGQNGGSSMKLDMENEWLSYYRRATGRAQDSYVELPPPSEPNPPIQTWTEPGGAYPGIEVNRAVIGGDYATFRELKAVYEAGIEKYSSKPCPESDVQEQEVNYDSDMEVRSMDLSDTDQDTFLCNPELFEFLKSFHIGDSDDEKFILKVCSVFIDALVKHKKRVRDLQKHIATEKLKLEEEKKAFEDKKKMNDPSNPSKSKKQAPDSNSNSSSKPNFPSMPLNNLGLSTMSAPLMSHLPGLYPTVPQSHWLQQSSTLPSEMLQGRWISAQPQGGASPHGSNTESGTAKR